MKLSYDGGAFRGWQKQPGMSTVQGALEDALRALLGKRHSVQGASRTDAGVHAEGQVASFSIDSTIPPERFAPALNAHLPPDVSVLRSEAVPESFDPRRDALVKLYRYAILNRQVRPSL